MNLTAAIKEVNAATHRYSFAFPFVFVSTFTFTFIFMASRFTLICIRLINLQYDYSPKKMFSQGEIDEYPVISAIEVISGALAVAGSSF